MQIITLIEELLTDASRNLRRARVEGDGTGAIAAEAQMDILAQLFAHLEEERRAGQPRLVPFPLAEARASAAPTSAECFAES